MLQHDSGGIAASRPFHKASAALALIIMLLGVAISRAEVTGASLSLPRDTLGQGGPVAGRPKAWGLNNRGELGIETRAYSNVPLSVHHLTGVVALAGGEEHSLALGSDGSVWAWGAGDWGQLDRSAPRCGAPDDVRATCSKAPARVPGLPHIIAIAAGLESSWALARDGAVWGWGSNRSGELGIAYGADCEAAREDLAGMGAGGCVTRPVAIPRLHHIVAIAGPGQALMAAGRDGSIWEAGNTVEGLWPDGVPTPILVQHIPGAIAMATCGWEGPDFVLTSGGTVWAWGDNTYGELGNGTDDRGSLGDHYHPQAASVRRLHDVVAIACDLAVRRDGTLWEWGGDAGDLPVQVRHLSHVVAIATSIWHTLALTRDGIVWARGENEFGQLGIGVSGGVKDNFVPVRGLSHAVAIAVGDHHSLAVQATVSPHYIPPRH